MEDRKDDNITRKTTADNLRRELRTLSASKEDVGLSELESAIYKRQSDDVTLDEFNTIYLKYGLLQPVYNFYTLYIIYEQSDVLQECIDAYIENIEGFGYQLQYLGEDQATKPKEELVNKVRLEDFFDHANDSESWTAIRKLVRKDTEVLGNGAFELVRNMRKELAMVFHIPFKTLRCTCAHPDPVTINTKIKRDGKLINIKLKKYFRRWAQVTGAEQVLTWFKSFGDPRIMDAKTGEFVQRVTRGMTIASEIMHFKLDVGGAAYGIPRWMGDVPDVLGRRSAQYINYDLMNSQGIPPMVVMVSGGTLTDESVKELQEIVRGMRGKEKWNKVALFESTPENTGLEERGNARIVLKNLTEYRKDDLMFANYLKENEETIRHTFRLPKMYIGSSETYTHSTSVVARITAEEQVFLPKRNDFDEIVDRQIINKEFEIYSWKYKTKGPKIVGSKELASGVDIFSKIGAFTINHAIAMANEAFGLQMSTFSEKWANYPIPMVLKLLELGQLSDIVTITGVKTPLEQNKQNIAMGNVAKMENIANKILDSKEFSKEEKDFYAQIMAMQYVMARENKL